MVRSMNLKASVTSRQVSVPQLSPLKTASLALKLWSETTNLPIKFSVGTNRYQTLGEDASILHALSEKEGNAPILLAVMEKGSDEIGIS